MFGLGWQLIGSGCFGGFGSKGNLIWGVLLLWFGEGGRRFEGGNDVWFILGTGLSDDRQGWKILGNDWPM